VAGSSLSTDINSHSASLHARPLSAWEKRRATRTTAHHATDAGDLAHLLDMIGLTAADGKADA
jgi:hypothetical protein